jgi:hypothetical protein
MLVGTTYKYYIFTPQAQVAGVNIGWQVAPRQVTNMDGAIGIYKCSGDGMSVEFLSRHSLQI